MDSDNQFLLTFDRGSSQSDRATRVETDTVLASWDTTGLAMEGKFSLDSHAKGGMDKCRDFNEMFDNSCGDETQVVPRPMFRAS